MQVIKETLIIEIEGNALTALLNQITYITPHGRVGCKEYGSWKA